MLLNEIICVYVDLVYIFNERVTIMLLERKCNLKIWNFSAKPKIDLKWQI